MATSTVCPKTRYPLFVSFCPLQSKFSPASPETVIFTGFLTRAKSCHRNGLKASTGALLSWALTAQLLMCRASFACQVSAT